MFVEEGFRIRFGNGECIDFYADSGAEKKGWMKVLNDTVGRCPDGKGWCEIVLKKERLEREKAPRAPPPGATRAQPTPVKQPEQKRPFAHQRTQSSLPMTSPMSPASLSQKTPQ